MNLSRIFGSDILFLLRPHRLVRSRTQGFHPWNRGSNPLGSCPAPRRDFYRGVCRFGWLGCSLSLAGWPVPPVDPVTLSELSEYQDPRSSLMAMALSLNDWSIPEAPRPWGSARTGEAVTPRGQVLQQGGFPQPWRDLEEWFVFTEQGTVAVYMKATSERPQVLLRSRFEAAGLPLRLKVVEAVAQLSWPCWRTTGNLYRRDFPLGGFRLLVQDSSCLCCTGFDVGVVWPEVQWVVKGSLVQ